MDQLDIEAIAERRYDLIRFIVPQQAVVDKDAGQLLADCLVDQHGSDRRIHPARQPADDPPVANHGTDAGDLGRAKPRHCPRTR